MKRVFQHFLFFMGLLLVLAACDRKMVFDQYKAIQKAEWQKDSVLTFDVKITDPEQNNDLFVNVRNDIDYKFSNLWLFIGITQPGDSIAATDTLEITLADPSGKWLGEGFGGIKTTQNLFRSNVYFPKPGIYKISIQQGMRGFVLEGITDIGVRVEKK